MMSIFDVIALVGLAMMTTAAVSYYRQEPR